MFTGLIGELGSITSIEKSESSAVFTISAPKLISQISVGDSVAVNGVWHPSCLDTITGHDGLFARHRHGDLSRT